MNKREALRFAASELESIAADLVREYKGTPPLDDWTETDMERIGAAFEELRFRMDRIATGAKRQARPAPVDPNQVPLFE